jgi:D-glycero-D-manno-heptose 1,7-bisphosphate phosphatase
VYKYVIFDRDGTLIKHVDYLNRIDQVMFSEGIFGSLKKLTLENYRIAIITNQSLINRKLGTHNQVNIVNDFIKEQLNSNSIRVEFILVCPHTPEEKCNCRKPEQEFMNYAISKFGLDANASFMVGDAESDMEFGKKGGCKTIQICPSKKRSIYADYVCDNLKEACEIILSKSR